MVAHSVHLLFFIIVWFVFHDASHTIDALLEVNLCLEDYPRIFISLFYYNCKFLNIMFLYYRAKHILCSHHGECCTHVRYYTNPYFYHFSSNSCRIILLKVVRCKCRWKHWGYLLPPTFVPY